MEEKLQHAIEYKEQISYRLRKNEEVYPGKPGQDNPQPSPNGQPWPTGAVQRLDVGGWVSNFNRSN